MLRESEYAGAYKSPEHPSTVSQQTAGLRSVDVASTEEPSFLHKRKTQDHAKRVSFGSGVVECTPLEQDAALKFRAGVRRPPNSLMTTEYQTHFTWKQPTLPPSPSPLSHRTEDSSDRNIEVGGGGGGGVTHTTEATPIDHELARSSARQGRSDEDGGTRGKGRRGQGMEVPRPAPSTKERCSSKKGCRGKRRQAGRSSPLTTEYRSQFKAPTQEVSKNLPKTSTDSHVEQQERERQKTSPQRDSIWSPQRDTVWSSEYSANFIVPSTLTYRKGAWIGAPHPDLYAPSPPRATSDVQTGSWFDQVVELRQEAEAYKMRQLSAHLLQSEDRGNHIDVVSDSSCSSCSSNSTASDGDSAVMPDVRPTKASNGAVTRAPAGSSVDPHGQEEVCVEDIEEGEEEEGGEKEVRERSEEEEEEEEKIRGSQPERYGQKKHFFSGEMAVDPQQAHTYDLRLSRPPHRNLNAQLSGGDGRDGLTPTPEVQAANRRMNRHSDVIPTSDGDVLPPSPFKPSSLPPHSPPPSPSQPTSGTRNADDSIPNRTAHVKPRSLATQPPPPPIPVASPSRPPHLSGTRHSLPVPTSMAFSVPLSPERPQRDGAQWLAFVRKRNKKQLESHVLSSREPEKVARKVAPPSRKWALPSRKVVPPSGEMVPPSRKVTSSPPASRKNTYSDGTAGPNRPNHPHLATTCKDVHMAKSNENLPHVVGGESGGLGTCKTCGAYLFPSRLGRDEAPPPGKLPSSSSSCRLCTTAQNRATSTGHLGTISYQSDKPHTIHGLHHTDAPHDSGPFPEPGAHKVPLHGTREPTSHSRGLVRHSSELSLSSLSSCSVASHILAHARERKDFWSSTVPSRTQ